MNLLVLASILSLSLGQIGRVSFFNQEVNMYIYELFIVAALISFVFTHPTSSRITWDFGGTRRFPFKISCVFFIYLFVSYFFQLGKFTTQQNIIGFLYFVRFIIYFLYFVILYVHRKEFGTTIRKGIMMFVGITLITSLLQYFLYPNLRNLIYLGWDEHLYRVFGTFLDTSVSGVLLGMSLLFLGFQKPKHRMVWGLIVGICICFLLTFSRGAYVALVISAIGIAIEQRKMKELFIILFCMTTIFIVLPKPFGEGVNLMRTSTINSRMTNLQEGLTVWQNNQLFGVGYDRIRYVRLDRNIDFSHSGSAFQSSFLTMLVAGGVIGLVLFMGMIKELMAIDRRGKWIVIFVCVASLFDNALLQPFVLLFLFLSIISISVSTKGTQ